MGAEIADRTGRRMLRRERRRAAGFTLIEMLVVLVIVAVIGGIVLSSYERILDIRIRLAAFLDGTDAPTLIAGWFRGSIEGLVADQKGGADVFAGTARRLDGLSLAPIDGRPGVPIRISWEVVFDPEAGRTRLSYREGGAAPMTIASWPGNRGGLNYCGPRLACADTWPPANQEASQMPALIVLHAVRGTEDWPLAAAPRAAHDPLPKTERLDRPSS